MTHEIVSAERIHRAYKKVQADPTRIKELIVLRDIMYRDSRTGFVTGEDLMTIELIEQENVNGLGQGSTGGYHRML